MFPNFCPTQNSMPSDSNSTKVGPSCCVDEIQSHSPEKFLRLSLNFPSQVSFASFAKISQTIPKGSSAEIKLHLIKNFPR